MTRLIVLSSDDLKTLERGGVLGCDENVRLIRGESVKEGIDRYYQKLAESEGVNDNRENQK